MTRHTEKRRRSAPLLWAGGGIAAVVLALGVNGTLSSWTEAVLTNDDNTVDVAAAVALEETVAVDDDGDPGTPPVFLPANPTCSTTTTPSNTATCSTINKYGDANVKADKDDPGLFGGTNALQPSVISEAISTTVKLTNTGLGDASSFTVGAEACASEYYTGPTSGSAPATADNVCSQILVNINCTGDATLTMGDPTLPASYVSLVDFEDDGDKTLLTGLASGATTTCVFHTWLPITTPSNFSGQTVTQSIIWRLSA